MFWDSHPPDAVAFTVVEPDLSAYDLTYGELTERSESVAAGLAALGVGRGDRVATLMGKSADLVATLAGIWRLGAVHVPLFTAFAAPAVTVRLEGSRAKVVICDGDQRAKVEPGPWQVAVVSPPAAPRGATIPAAGELPDDPLVHIYTSGTTGAPKGVIVPRRALKAFTTYLELGLDVQPDDVYWNAADPGWAYGLYYGVMAPLARGNRSLLLHAGFSPELTWQVLARFGVTNFAAAPTVYRGLRASGIAPPEGLRLRCLSSAGEPLTGEVNEWAREALRGLVHDHYGQTEMGMLVLNHHHASLREELQPGSMGRAMPGWSVTVLEPDRIAVDISASPLAWFHGYHENAEATAERFSSDGRWYFTGDSGRLDDAGRFWFSARDDDVIIMAGYRIGPFEVESVLATHPAVAECAVIAAPDALRGEVLEACVVLRPGQAVSEAELQTLVKQRYAAHAYPRAIHFLDALPKTPSGKIQRYVLRQQRREGLLAGA